MSIFVGELRIDDISSIMKTQISLQAKGAYTAPEVELMSLAKGNSLLMTFSGDIEIWEDDEELIIEL